jgi:hypothetical protein
MPDVFTHLLTSHIIVRAPNLFKNKFLQLYVDYRIMIYLGAILPDLISKPFQYISMSFYNFALPLHSPFCITIICLIIIQFFFIKDRINSFIILLIFSLFHILMDNLQKGVNPGYQTLFPISLKRYGISIISSETYLILSASFFVLIIVIEILILIRPKIRKVLE